MTGKPAAYTPSLAELSDSDLTGRTVTVSREILADLDTPVSAYLKVRDTGPSFLLESVEGGERVGRYSFLGSNPRGVIRLKGGMLTRNGVNAGECANPLDAVRDLLEAYSPCHKPTARFEGGALGYLAYEAGGCFERIPAAANDPLDLPDAAFLDVDTVLIFDHVAHTIRVVSHAWLDVPLPDAYALAVEAIERVIKRLQSPLESGDLQKIEAGPLESNLEPQEFARMVKSAKEYIGAGDILQVVLSQRLSIPFRSEPFGLYRRLRTVSPSPYMYFLDFGDHQIVGASPELLVQVEDCDITERPIAGTRRRGVTAPQDRAMADELLADEKERAEHLMLVDLARNDVGRVSAAGSVQVSNFMTVERFSHVMHLVSDVTGQLAVGMDGLGALQAAFPAGTVSGAPKIRAMEIIAELEPDSRGPYAGSLGFINTVGDMEMAITIRTGIVKDGMLYVQAGAGIVADSVPEREYEETMNKARGLLQAAGVRL